MFIEVHLYYSFGTMDRTSDTARLINLVNVLEFYPFSDHAYIILSNGASYEVQESYDELKEKLGLLSRLMR